MNELEAAQAAVLEAEANAAIALAAVVTAWIAVDRLMRNDERLRN